MPNPSKQNKVTGSEAKLRRARRNIYLQAGLAMVTIVLTVVILFAMTSAWYTNVVHTSGLTFEAAAWGFDGAITVGSNAVKAAPGDEGVVELTVSNDTDAISDISINVSKATMDAEMQKRLFFYVDTHEVSNGETVERVYLSNQDSYTYTLFSYSSLVLTEEYHNDAQLKWQWVYDVLGYYVLATETDITDADGKPGVNMSIQEYLRPIEYDYDAATTTFISKTEENEEGEEETVLELELETVDGETKVDEFLVALSQRDGYAGTIDPTQKNEAGYYPVDVDENGFGVWAYLCSYSEIEMNTQYDTALGKAADEGNGGAYTARLTVSAQKSKTDITLVSTSAALLDALQSQDNAVIQLDSDIAMENPLTLTKGQNLVLDLNGHTLNSSGNVAIDAGSGSSVTVFNGSLAGQGESGYGIISTGAEVTLNDVDVTNVKYGVYVMDNTDANHLDSKVRLTDCTMTTSDCSIYVLGNGEASTQMSQIIIENCTITSGYNAVCGNGTATGGGKWGTDIQIINSTVTGKWSALYQPQQNSFATVYNSTLSGFTGIAIKGGTVTITDSTISGTGPAQELKEPYYAASGFADTGDAVYIESGYGYEIVLEVSGNSVLLSDNAASLQVYDAAADNVAVILHSGTYQEEQPEEYLADGAVQNELDEKYIIATE